MFNSIFETFLDLDDDSKNIILEYLNNFINPIKIYIIILLILLVILIITNIYIYINIDLIKNHLIN